MMRHIFVRSLDGGRVRRRRGFAVREESTRASRGGVADVAIPARSIIRGQSSRARKSHTLTCSTHRTHRVTWARAPFSSRSRERRSSRARRPGRRDETTFPARARAPASAHASPPAPPRVRDYFHPPSAPRRRRASGQRTPRPRHWTRQRNAHTQKRRPPALKSPPSPRTASNATSRSRSASRALSTTCSPYSLGPRDVPDSPRRGMRRTRAVQCRAKRLRVAFARRPARRRASDRLGAP